MNLSDQVTSLEVSRRLKELGVKQESYWYHYHYVQGGHFSIYRKHELYGRNPENPCYSAYTVVEFLHVIPAAIERGPKVFAFHISKGSDKTFGLGYSGQHWMNEITNLADGLAELLIWGIKEGYISIEEINKKL